MVGGEGAHVKIQMDSWGCLSGHKGWHDKANRWGALARLGCNVGRAWDTRDGSGHRVKVNRSLLGTRYIRDWGRVAMLWDRD